MISRSFLVKEIEKRDKYKCRCFDKYNTVSDKRHIFSPLPDHNTIVAIKIRRVTGFPVTKKLDDFKNKMEKQVTQDSKT